MKTIVILLTIGLVSCTMEPFEIETVNEQGKPVNINHLGWTIMTKAEERYASITTKSGKKIESYTKKRNETTVPTTLLNTKAAVDLGAQMLQDSISKTDAAVETTGIKEAAKVQINESQQVTKRILEAPVE